MGQCWEEQENVCKSHPECHTSYVDHCTPLFKKVCSEEDDSKKGKKDKDKKGGHKKWKREAIEDEEETAEEKAETEKLKKLSAADLLEIAQDAAIAEAENNDGKEKRGIKKIGKLALKLIKNHLKKDDKKGSQCEDVPHGEHCEKVAVEKCHDVEKCWKEPKTQCKKVPHEKCWQEPHEKCWNEPQEKCWQEPHQKCWQEPRESCWDEPQEKCWKEPHQKCWQEPQEKCWQEAHEKCWDEPKQVCWQEPHEKCWEEPHEQCTQHPKEHCDYVKVKVAKRWCPEKKEKEDSGKKFWKKVGKLIGH